MKNRRFLKLLFLEVIGVAGVLIYFFVDSADIYRLFMGDTKFYSQSSLCDLHFSPCSVDIPELGLVEFEIEPKGIPLMKSLTFKVKTKKDIGEESLDLHIYATNMNMGYHNFTLKRVSKNSYEARGVLPTCTVGGMIWNAEVVDGNRGGLFSFKTQ